MSVPTSSIIFACVRVVKLWIRTDVQRVVKNYRFLMLAVVINSASYRVCLHLSTRHGVHDIRIHGELTLNLQDGAGPENGDVEKLKIKAYEPEVGHVGKLVATATDKGPVYVINQILWTHRGNHIIQRMISLDQRCTR